MDCRASRRGGHVSSRRVSSRSGTVRFGRGRRPGIRLRLVLLAGLLANLIVLGAPGVVFAAGCETSGPVAGSYSITVCITEPADGATVSGPVSVTTTATASGGGPGVQRMVFYLDGQYLLTDFQSPYTFTLPSDRFVDGTRVLEVEALMRDGFVSQRASIGLEFANGVTTPPPPATGSRPPPGPRRRLGGHWWWPPPATAPAVSSAPAT